MAKVTYKPNRSFLLNPIPDAKRAVGVRQGALVRTIARRTIRRRKRDSRPGESPTNRTGTLKRLLFYSWDPATQSVVIGPEALGKAEAPALLEFGGSARRRGKTARYSARPFMAPALDKAMAKLPELWNNAIN